jgi:hypothetical protein
MTDALFPIPRRRVGQSEALLAKTLHAWHQDGVLVGAKWAVHRGILRDAARVVDLARDDARSDDAAVSRFGRANRTFAELLGLYLSGQEVNAVDGIDALIANISGPPTVRDTPHT